MSKPITIEELKLQNATGLPQSPRKCGKSIKCAVLSKSELKGTKYGKMFTMTLCDENPSSSIKAICFEESMHEKFQATHTYYVKFFKVKRGMGGGNPMEVLVDCSTEVTEASDQFNIGRMTFTISQIIRNETEDVRFLHLKAKVVAIYDVETVGKYPEQKDKREIFLGDEIGHVSLVLWRERAKDINFKEDDVLRIQNAIKTTFNNKVLITTCAETIIQKVEENIIVSAAAAKEMKRKRGIVSSVETSILAIKDFKATYKCINCRSHLYNYESKTESTSNILLTCPLCRTVFLRQVSSLMYECTFLLSSNNKWFTANSAVVQHIFQWNEEKSKPSQHDLLTILKSKYCMRLDVERKVIEYATTVTERCNPDFGNKEGEKHLFGKRAREDEGANTDDDEDMITTEDAKKLLSMETNKAKVD